MIHPHLIYKRSNPHIHILESEHTLPRVKITMQASIQLLLRVALDTLLACIPRQPDAGANISPPENKVTNPQGKHDHSKRDSSSCNFHPQQSNMYFK
jgi:hypothetical protein